MERGWTPLWRKSDESAVFQDANLWRLWTWLLMKTAHEKQFVPISTGRGEVIVTLEPGQCLVGRHSGGKALGWPSSTFRNRLERLTQPPFECITIVKDTHSSVVTIVKWMTYKVKPKTKGQPKDNRRTTEGHIEELKALKEKYINIFSEDFWTAWCEWEQFRTEKKKTLTFTTIKRQFSTLSKLPMPQAILTLERSIENGWVGLFPERAAQQSGKGVYNAAQHGSV